MATNHHLRNAATHGAMRDLVRAGAIGRPLAASVVHAGYLPPHLHGWRLRDAAAGAGAILDLVVHDADLLRFILGDDPLSVMALAQNGGLAAEGIDDAAQCLLRFRSGLLAHLFVGFTTPFAEQRVEVHGGGGSLIARDCMAQAPGGTLMLRDGDGERPIALDHQNYYTRGVRAFEEAVAGRGAPAATGRDGVISLAVALAALESGRTGREITIETGS